LDGGPRLNWYNPENLSFIIQWVALGCFLAALLVFVFWVALPVHRLVSKLAAYAEARGDVLPGALKNDVDTLNHVFKYLTEDLRKKEDALRGMVEQARTRVRFMERYNDRLVESVPVALLGFDGSGRLASVNSTAERIFYVRAADVLGKGAEVFWSSLPEGLDWVGAAVLGGHPIPGREVKWVLPTGESLVAELSGAPLPEGEGKDGGYVVAVFDRTPLRRLEEQARMNQQLASLVDLSTGLAHQVRNPLGGVLGYTDLILRKSDGEIAELAGHVKEDALLLKKVVDDFLEFLRERETAEKPLDWREVLPEVVADLEKERQKKGVRLTLRPCEGIPTARLDRGSAYQAAFNLVLNALEATPSGGEVAVGCRSEEGAFEVSLIVEDSGSGLPEGLFEKAFHPFFTTKPEGRGLGLAVVQRVAQSAKGRVTVGRSPLGGARFALTLPTVGARSGEGDKA